jgi:acyl carrier protein
VASLDERLRRLLVEQTGGSGAWDSLDEDTQIVGAGIGLSSLDTVSLMVRIENEFDLFFEADEFGESLKNFGTLLSTVRRKIEEVTGRESPKDEGTC